MNSRIRAAGLALALTFVASACSAPAGQNDEETGELTLWGWRQDDPWVSLLEEYNATEPDVPIRYQGYKSDEYNTVLQTGLSSNTGPDLMMLRSYGGLDTVAAGGGLLALDDELEELDGFSPQVLDGARSLSDGDVYGVPFQIVTANVLYNADVFERLDLEEPETWQEFIEVNEKVAEDGLIPLAMGSMDAWPLPIFRDLFGSSAYGGPEFQQDLVSGSADFTDPRYASANSTLLDLARFMPEGHEGVNYVDAITLFVSGRAAMLPAGIWELPSVREQAPDMTLGIFNAPRTDGSADEPFAMGYVDGSFGASAELEGAKKEAALDFLRWVASEEFGRLVADELLAIPTVSGVTPTDDLLREATQAFEENPTPYLTYVSFDHGSPSGTSLEFENLQKMMLGQMSPDEVGDQVQAGVSQWFEPTG